MGWRRMPRSFAPPPPLHHKLAPRLFLPRAVCILSTYLSLCNCLCSPFRPLTFLLFCELFFWIFVFDFIFLMFNSSASLLLSVSPCRLAPLCNCTIANEKTLFMEKSVRKRRKGW